MKVISLDRDVPETWLIGPAIDVVRKGGLILFPTDSVYALGCDPFDRKAVDKLYTAKGMTENHRCSVICGDLKQVASVARAVSDAAFHFMRRHFPGPYTVLLKASRDLPKEATGKRKQIGVRMPDHPVPLTLVEDFGKPLLVTSVPAWLAGDELDPVAIAERLAVRPDLVLDQGPQIADPSTVLDFSVDPPELVRMGKGPVDWVE
ncbi:MAG: threonylcarbamoyl-AMP synthase [Deltaproteobacteria bacterium]|nr:threonylcarbamoyl-AMP synthase [Deltaproteobacteria bacterium]